MRRPIGTGSDPPYLKYFLCNNKVLNLAWQGSGFGSDALSMMLVIFTRLR
jgi:hypothetical protein